MKRVGVGRWMEVGVAEFEGPMDRGNRGLGNSRPRPARGGHSVFACGRRAVTGFCSCFFLGRGGIP